MQRLTGFVALAGALGCSTAAPENPERSYLRDADYRATELRASLVSTENGYATRRLASYGAAWERLPVWNPRVLPITVGDVGLSHPGPPLGDAARALAIDAAAGDGDAASLLRLGRDAFERYPTQLLLDGPFALASVARARDYGFALDASTDRVGGLVRAEMADGTSRVAMTCSTCHTGERDGVPVSGAPNARLDLGRLAIDAGTIPNPDATRLAAWGPGRLDVSSHDGSEPARIPDLRPVRFLTHLHQDATLRQRSIVTLALRIETQIITSYGEALRPPREIALGLAVAVWAFAADLPGIEPLGDEANRGAAVVARACSPCHATNSLTGPPISLAAAGTDPTLGLSPERGTGLYRVPSLRGVGTRGPLLHDASAPDLETFFEPDRLDATFTGGRGRAPVPGHRANLELSDDDRRAALAYLRGL